MSAAPKKTADPAATPAEQPDAEPERKRRRIAKGAGGAKGLVDGVPETRAAKSHAAFYQTLPHVALLVAAPSAARSDADVTMVRFALAELVAAVNVAVRALAHRRTIVAGARARYAELDAKIAALRASFISETGYETGDRFDSMARALRKTLATDLERSDANIVKLQVQVAQMRRIEGGLARSVLDNYVNSTECDLLPVRAGALQLREMLAGMRAEAADAQRSSEKDSKRIAALRERFEKLVNDTMHVVAEAHGGAPMDAGPAAPLRVAVRPLPRVLAAPPIRAPMDRPQAGQGGGAGSRTGAPR